MTDPRTARVVRGRTTSQRARLVALAALLMASGCGASDDVRAARSSSNADLAGPSAAVGESSDSVTGADDEADAFAAPAVAGEGGEPGAASTPSPGASPGGAAVAPGGAAVEKEVGVADDAVRVAGWFILSGAGGDLLGKTTVDAWNAGIQLRNDEGGVSGRRYVGYPVDSQLECGTGMANVRKAVESDDIFAFGGTYNPYLAGCVVPYLDEQGVPAVFADGIDPRVANYEWSFPVGANHDRVTRIGVRYALNQMGAKTLALIGHSDALFDTVVARAKEVAGDKLVATERIAYDEGNMAPLVQRLASKKPGAIYIYVNPDRAIILLQEMERQGYKPPNGIIGATSLANELVPDSVGAFADGLLAMTNVAWNDSPAPGIREMRAALDRYAPDTPIDGYTGKPYAAFRYFHLMVKSVGRNLTRERLRDAIYQARGFDNAGLVPPLTFAPGAHEASKGVQIVVVKDGDFTFLEDWIIDE